MLELALGSRESYEAWLAFGREMIDRGVRAPALVIADGAPGTWKATRELWPDALEQRCTVHALRNVAGKVPERDHAEVKARWWKAFDDARSPGEATRELQGIIADYPAAFVAVTTARMVLVMSSAVGPQRHRSSELCSWAGRAIRAFDGHACGAACVALNSARLRGADGRVAFAV